ncbi:TetR/AcrR family transcriptional regulator [Microvirga terrestris]|uniref:TetR/AcrR family transcriptional regulator C-terminal domain-containing protein n=1 Tax=Microvirga terrestris TaxID=2791024 RepID=A0ABS0HND9_9HYPH|nr:TetR/AcrR family transcriptional regulator C-terminal domain-containing protein [Microvirga terrestris]MBF9194995.1 TetR/AcrR family transcriptional regulator C-terminal domain-containing protein [Microvirga terrestris]
MTAKPKGARNKRSQGTDVSPASEKGPNSEPPLSLERIVTTAVELLDAHGVDGLKMRQLADRLGSGAMSLYWHVDNKEQVFDLALDSVLKYCGPPQSVQSQDWRGDVIHMLEDWRASMLRHPWSASLLPRRALGPNILGRLELLSKTLSRAGVTDADLNVAIWSLWNYVIGATITRASFDLSDDDRAAAQQRLTGLSEQYPTIERSRLLMDNDWDGAFRKGLDFLLDGLAPKQ